MDRTKLRVVTVLLVVLTGLNNLAVEAIGPHPGVDLVQFARDFTTVVYLQPLALTGAKLRVVTETFRSHEAPLCADVHIIPTGKLHPGVVSVCVANGRLWFAGADQEFLEFYSRALVGERVREERTAAIVQYLNRVASATTSGQRRSGKPGYFELQFDVPVTQFARSGVVGAVFNHRSGLLAAFGAPFPAEAR